MSRSQCAMSNNQPNGISTFWVSSDGMMECGRESPPSLAREIPRSRCFRCAMVIQNLERAAVGSACCISLFVQTGKIFSVRSESLRSAESNSNSRTTKFLTPSIFAIPTATSSRLRLTNSRIAPRHVDNCAVERHPASLRSRDAAAAVFVFFSAATGARLVAANLWH
jgi:hypothetical protein